MNLRMLTCINTEPHLHHPYQLLIHKPSISLAVGFTGAFVAGCWCGVLSRCDLEQGEVEARLMRRSSGGGDREDRSSAGSRCCRSTEKTGLIGGHTGQVSVNYDPDQRD